MEVPSITGINRLENMINLLSTQIGEENAIV